MDEFERTDYKGITVYRAQDDDHSFAFALANDNMIVASPEVAAVHAMLDRLSGQGSALSKDGDAMEQIRRVSGSSSAWFVARDLDQRFAQVSHDGELDADVAQLGRSVRDVSVALTITADGAEGTVFMNPQADVSADDLADLTKGVIAAMKASPELDDDKLRALDQARVRTDGDQVRVTFFVENDMLPSR